MARTREFDPNAVLDTAVELFWNKGYGNCSVADVVEESGVARYGIYQEFGDKDALYRAALKRYRVRAQLEFLRDLKTPDAGIDEIREHFARLKAMLDEGDRRGCLACQAALDRAQADPEVADTVSAAMRDMRDAFGNAVDGALAREEIRRLPRDSLVEFLVGLQRTLGTLVRSSTPAEEIERYIEASVAMLEP